MGSGSTGVACLNTNRKFIGIELDEHYFNVAKNRIYNNSNKIS
jgi:site-specific DNA-methyltransferase (adenine-specific)